MAPAVAPRDWGFVLPPVVLALLATLAWTYQQRPFRDLVAHHAVAIAALTPEQRRNVRLAGGHLDGHVIAPGEHLSFNAVVGQRTRERGYVEAPAFLEGVRTRSVGGGVCLVASTLYAAIQPTTWRVLQRTAHPRRSRLVPPGRDATVWYGQTDLVLQNTFGGPVRLRVAVDEVACRVELWGRSESGQRQGLRFSYAPGRRRGEQQVQVFRQAGNRSVLLSQDAYLP